MRREPLNSRTVRSLGYDPSDSILEVEFHDGRVYQYYLVPDAVVLGLLAADSIGHYMNEHVIGKYPYREVS